jgi:hypothetical protein
MTASFVSEFDLWLDRRFGVEKINDLSYILWYNGSWCFLKINIMPNSKDVKIMPLNINDNIGLGKGKSINLRFKRKKK